MAVYAYYLREKNSEYRIIKEGICPRCHHRSMVLSDQRGGGCGPRLVTYSCTECGYENSFSVDGSCGL